MSKRSFSVLKLHFKETALHLGKGRTEEGSNAKGIYDQTETSLASDTLKSAILANALQLYPHLAETSASQNFLNGFKLSSGFLFVGNTYFFPKPLGLVIGDTASPDKTLKRIKYLAQPLFEQILNGKTPKIEETEVIQDLLFEKQDPFVIKKQSKVYAKELQQKVTIPRDYEQANEEPEPYFIEKIHFNQETGFFVLFEFEDPALAQQVKAAVRLLGDNGLGMDRSTGCGFFKPEWTSLELKVPEQSAARQHYLTLSLYAPKYEEVQDWSQHQNEHAPRYELVKRGGYLTFFEDQLSLRKKSIYFLKEAAVLRCQQNPEGSLHNLKPEILAEASPPVWRDGRTITLPYQPQASSHT